MMKEHTKMNSENCYHNKSMYAPMGTQLADTLAAVNFLGGLDSSIGHWKYVLKPKQCLCFSIHQM